MMPLVPHWPETPRPGAMNQWSAMDQWALGTTSFECPSATATNDGRGTRPSFGSKGPRRSFGRCGYFTAGGRKWV